MNHYQLRDLIFETLKPFDLNSNEAIELLLLTAATETNCGEYIKQINGPALGIFQMEPNTLIDLQGNFLFYNEKYSMALDSVKIFGLSIETNLHGNLFYQIMSARLQYLRFPEKIPKRKDHFEEYDFVKALANYWKKYWNTSSGKGTVDKAMNDYDKYVRC